MTDELQLQFSTAAQNWRDWAPQFVRRDTGIPCLMFDKNWGSGLIRRANHSPFSHCDMVMDDGNLLGSSNSPDAPVIEGNPNGVAIRPTNYQHFAYRRRMVINTHRAADIREIAKTQLGKGFDNSALKDFVSDRFPGERNWRLDDCWFCAELIVWALEVGQLWGDVQLPWPKNRVSPTDILLIMLMDPRWANRDSFWEPIPNLQLDSGER